MKPWLILPTYNEIENLEAIISAVVPILRETCGRDGFTVLVVDDSSPDGTGELADRLVREHGELEVLHRPRREGLGPAYIAGFTAALADDASHLIEMDADFSHEPHDLPRLLDAARDADLVLGSRYVPGGVVADWGLLRRIISRGGSLYARRVLGLDVADLTGGFKCFRREVLESIGLEGIHSRGYAFQVELTYRAVRAGFRVIEVPIVFRDRRLGRSKMSLRIATEAIVVLPQLRRSAIPTSPRSSGIEASTDSAHTPQTAE
jgi:dolichol-phosphate mannosyltransferase